MSAEPTSAEHLIRAHAAAPPPPEPTRSSPKRPPRIVVEGASGRPRQSVAPPGLSSDEKEIVSGFLLSLGGTWAARERARLRGEAKR